MVTRPGASTSLIVSVVASDGSWRYLEDRPPESFVRVEDVRRCVAMIGSAEAVVLQSQEPGEALLEAARIGQAHGDLVVVDGAPPQGIDPEALYRLADVVRADQHEAGLIAGEPIEGAKAALDAGRRLLERGPRVAVFAAGEDGNAIVWNGGNAVLSAVVPHLPVTVVDTTGGGDALLAGMVTGLLQGSDPLTAACMGTAAAGCVVTRLGGRPALFPGEVAVKAAWLEAHAWHSEK